MIGMEYNSPPPPGEALVSVIIICYNQARFLGEAIESVLRQTYKHYEIIVMDDDSTDDPAAVAARYPGVRFFTQPNQGTAGATRNSGFRQSKGEYLVFLDADDRLLPNALEVGVAGMNAHPECGFSVGRFLPVSVDGTPLPLMYGECSADDHYDAFLRWQHSWSVATILFRRSVFESVGGFNGSKNMMGVDDFDLVLRISRNLPVHCHNQITAEYRFHSANTSRNVEMMFRSSLAVFRSEWPWVKGNKKYEEALRRGLRHCRDRFAEELVEQVRAQARSRSERKQALSGVLALARLHPRILLKHAYRKTYCLVYRVKGTDLDEKSAPS
jgi:glycosyltransferase involved in cell wall biosynthesis